MRISGLLVLPGWGDDGRLQFDALAADLAPARWTCHRATIPDTSWSDSRRASVSRDDSMHHLLRDYGELAAAPGVARGRIALAGFSYGAYMATFLSAAKPVRRLVLRSPAIYPDDDWSTPKEALDKLRLDDYRARVLTPAQNRSLGCCAQFRGDVLLVDSENDEVIPPTVIESYARAFKGARSLTRHTLKGADHPLTCDQWQQEYRAVLVSWLHARSARRSRPISPAA